jgi:hypothetical protein
VQVAGVVQVKGGKPIGPDLANGLPVIPIIPSSQITVGAPSRIVTGPAVLRLTTSFSVPGSLPWHVFSTEPTVATAAPLIFVRIAASPIPSTELATTGYGMGKGLGAAGVVHTLAPSGVTVCPLFSVMTFGPAR